MKSIDPDYHWSAIPIDDIKLLDLTSRCVNRVKYKYAAKAPNINCKPTAIKRIDCSGFVRWLIHNASNGEVTMPDGSWNQNAWCHSLGLKKTAYSNCALLDNRLRIAFIGCHPIGHVWLCFNSKTIESYGGHGVGRQSWRVYQKKVDICYVLTDVL